MAQEEKTVEQQIAESELINNLKKHIGEGGEEIARDFISLDRRRQMIIMLYLSIRSVAPLDSLEATVLQISIQQLAKKAPEDFDAFCAVVVKGIGEKLKKEKSEARENNA